MCSFEICSSALTMEFIDRPQHAFHKASPRPHNSSSFCWTMESKLLAAWWSVILSTLIIQEAQNYKSKIKRAPERKQ